MSEKKNAPKIPAPIDGSDEPSDEPSVDPHRTMALAVLNGMDWDAFTDDDLQYLSRVVRAAQSRGRPKTIVVFSGRVNQVRALEAGDLVDVEFPEVMADGERGVAIQLEVLPGQLRLRDLVWMTLESER